MNSASNNENTQNAMSVGAGNSVVSLNFAPDWARKPPGQGFHGVHADESSASRRRGASHANRSRRPFDGTRDAAPAKRPAPGSHGKPEQPAVSPARPRRDDGKVFKSFQYRRRHEAIVESGDKVEALPVRIRFLPGQERLKAIARRISASRKSYPLLKMAALFFRQTDYCCVKIESEPGDAGIPLYQCKKCKSVALDRSFITPHIMTAHIEEYFKKEEKLTETPGGEFVCVARCGLSGILLAPPNHHSYAERIQEIHNSRFPRLSLDEYRKHIETSHDPKLIEQWKEEVRRQILYLPMEFPRKKHGGSPESEAVPMKWTEAEAFVEEHIAPDIIIETRRTVLPANVASQTQDERLARRIREVWHKEKRFPIAFSYALRSAFHNMGLHVFGTDQRIDYVCSVRPCRLATNHVDPSVREILDCLEARARCARQNIVEALRPGRLMDAPEAQDVLTNLSWMIEKGHIIEFHDGTLSLPNARPRTQDNVPTPVPSADNKQ